MRALSHLAVEIAVDPFAVVAVAAEQSVRLDPPIVVCPAELPAGTEGAEAAGQLAQLVGAVGGCADHGGLLHL